MICFQAKANVLESDFFGFMPWIIIQRVTLPLTVFFYFHSAVVFIELFKEVFADEEEHDDEPVKSNTPLENADDPSLVRPIIIFFFLETDSCVLFLFIGVWEGESFNCLSIQQRNIPSVNFYGTHPSVELAMLKIQEKIASTKVSFSF